MAGNGHRPHGAAFQFFLPLYEETARAVHKKRTNQLKDGWIARKLARIAGKAGTAPE
jgi:hypothetical protein